MITKKMITGFLAISICFTIYAAEVSGAPKKPKIKRTTHERTIEGKLGYIDSKTISVIYFEDKSMKSINEAAFYLDPALKINYKRSLDEIQIGDTVRITYIEIIDATEDGEIVKSKRVATAVTFVRPKTTGFRSG
ncbi:MAG: hypothetical protein ABID09_01150 [Candidatus Omnitrophota bacterium]